MQISDRSIVAAAIWAGFDVTVELLGLVCKNGRKGGVAAIVAKLEMAQKREQLGRTVDFETTPRVYEKYWARSAVWRAKDTPADTQRG
jgi:hypothetical protein